MTNQIRRPSEMESGNAQVREVKAKLVRDYIDNQEHAPKPVKASAGAANTLQGGQLVFSVLDDAKLYGAEALDREFHDRQYDPYRFYKNNAETEVVQRPRSLHLSVSESA